MALPITVPYTFGNATTAIPLSNLDSDYATVYQAVNGIGNGSVALANVAITGGTISGNTTASNVTVSSGTFTNVTLSNVTISSVSTPITAAEGGTGSSSAFTTNGVAYATSTSALATGSALTFDGTNLGVGGAALSLPAGYTVSQVSGTSGAGLFRATSTSVDIRFQADQVGSVGLINVASNHPLAFNVNATERMRLTSAGYLGIGTSSPQVPLQVTGIIKVATGNSQGIISLGDGAGATTNCGIYRGSAGAPTTDGNFLNFGGYDGLVFTTGASAIASQTERMRIDSSGNLLVGTTSTSISSNPGLKFANLGSSNFNISLVDASSSSGDIRYTLYSTGAGAYRFYVDMGGTIHATSIVISAISDERLKENVRDIDTGLNTILALKPRRFDWKEGKGQDKKNVAGFIAQEFETVFPECVGTSKAGADGIEYKNINYETLVPTLVKAIQELSAEVNALKAKLGV